MADRIDIKGIKARSEVATGFGGFRDRIEWLIRALWCRSCDGLLTDAGHISRGCDYEHEVARSILAWVGSNEDRADIPAMVAWIEEAATEFREALLCTDNPDRERSIEALLNRLVK